MGCYLAPNNTSTIERVVEALRERPKGAELLVAGDLNINFAALEDDQREEDIAATLAKEVLEDMAPHFLLHRQRRGKQRRTGPRLGARKWRQQWR